MINNRDAERHLFFDISIINNYPEDIQNKVLNLLERNELNIYLIKKYPGVHNINSNKLLFKYAQRLKKQYMKNASPLHKVVYDDSIERVYDALGFNRSTSRIHGKGLKVTKEIRISSIFKKAPKELLDMIIIHELAHLKVQDHNKRFYSLCEHMNPDYFQLEFDLKLYLIYLNNINKLQ